MTTSYSLSHRNVFHGHQTSTIVTQPKQNSTKKLLLGQALYKHNDWKTRVGDSKSQMKHVYVCGGGLILLTWVSNNELCLLKDLPNFSREASPCEWQWSICSREICKLIDVFYILPWI